MFCGIEYISATHKSACTRTEVGDDCLKLDAIVIGAGPAGLTASKVISSSGFKVALFEKRQDLGVKPCGEAVSEATLHDAGIAPSSEFVAQQIKCGNVYAPNGKKVSIRGESAAGYILNKSVFLERMAEQAAESHVHIYMNHEVTDFERGRKGVKIKTSTGEFEARLVLGGDGFASTVSRKFGFEKGGEREIIPCIQYSMENCELRDTEAAEFFLGNEVAPLGYAWIFPKGNRKANVGIGVRGTPGKPYLDKFIKENLSIFAGARTVRVEAAPVTIGGLLEKIVDDNVMLVGEAAGQVMPLTGGGIHASIVGGRMAGETAIAALREENYSRDRLFEYAERYNEHWGKRIRDSLKALRVLDKLDDVDLNRLADLLEQQDILDLANGLDLKRVGHKFLKHPWFSLKIAKALLSA